MFSFNLSEELRKEMNRENEKRGAHISEQVYFGTEEQKDVQNFMMDTYVDGEFFPDDPKKW